MGNNPSTEPRVIREIKAMIAQDLRIVPIMDGQDDGLVYSDNNLSLYDKVLIGGQNLESYNGIWTWRGLKDEDGIQVVEYSDEYNGTINSLISEDLDIYAEVGAMTFRVDRTLNHDDYGLIVEESEVPPESIDFTLGEVETETAMTVSDVADGFQDNDRMFYYLLRQYECHPCRSLNSVIEGNKELKRTLISILKSNR